MVVDTDDWIHKGCFIRELTLNGKPLQDDRVYRVGVTQNCLENFPRYFHLQAEDCSPRRVSFSTIHDLERWFLRQQSPVTVQNMGRLTFLNYHDG